MTAHRTASAVYPMAAFYGSDHVRRAMLLLLVNPRIGGLLLLGRKGSGKSVLLHSLCELTQRPLVHIPLHATPDRLLGSLSLEAVLGRGEKVFEKGLLSEAAGGFLLMDDLSFLPESLLRTVLNTHGNGVLQVEREGLGHREHLDFRMIGSMNPEDGGLSASQLDRFALCVSLDDEVTEEGRAEILRRMMAFDENPTAFCRSWSSETDAIRAQIADAAERISKISLSNEHLGLIGAIVRDAGCAGHRGELALCEAARALAALSGREEILEADIIEAAKFALAHRMRDFSPKISAEDGHNEAQESAAPREESEVRPQEELTPSDEAQADAQEERLDPSDADLPPLASPERGNAGAEGQVPAEDSGRISNAENFPWEDLFSEGDLETSRPVQGGVDLIWPLRKQKALGDGRRRQLVHRSDRGHEIGYEIPIGKVKDLAIGATLRAAATDGVRATVRFGEGAAAVRDGEGAAAADFAGTCPAAKGADGREKSGRDVPVHFTGQISAESKKRDGRPCLDIRPYHLREKKKESTGGARILFLVDGSGSMGAKKRMQLIKGAVLSILGESYLRRDAVGVMVFKGTQAKLVLPFTRSIDRAKRVLEEIRTGGRTPLLLGLEEAAKVLKLDRMKHRHPAHLLIVVSDGKNNVFPGGCTGTDGAFLLEQTGLRLRNSGLHAVVIDTEHGFMRFGYAKRLSDALDAQYVDLSDKIEPRRWT